MRRTYNSSSLKSRKNDAFEGVDFCSWKMTTATPQPPPHQGGGGGGGNYHWHSERRTTTTTTTTEPVRTIPIEQHSNAEQFRTSSQRTTVRTVPVQIVQNAAQSGQWQHSDSRVIRENTPLEDAVREVRSVSRASGRDLELPPKENLGWQEPQHLRAESREYRSESRASHASHAGGKPDPVDQKVAQWRSESRASQRTIDPSEHNSVVNDTLEVLKKDVEQTTEIIRRKQQQMILERRQFQTEMEVTGRIEISPQDDWLTTRLKNVSTDDMKKKLNQVKDDQQRNAYNDTLAALVYDVNATAEVLRRGSLGRNKEKKAKQVKEEVEYRLRLTPAPDEEPFPAPKPRPPPAEDNFTVEEVSRDYGVEMTESQTNSMRRRRARSETPRRTLRIEGSPPPTAPAVCAYCSEEIDGPILTALAPNSERAQKFHTYHFMCTYCQKALNMHGTYREHEKKPYCHDCFYKLYNGLLYEPDTHQSTIEKLI